MGYYIIQSARRFGGRAQRVWVAWRCSDMFLESLSFASDQQIFAQLPDNGMEVLAMDVNCRAIDSNWRRKVYLSMEFVFFRKSEIFDA